MEEYQIIANVIMFIAGICSILSIFGKRKKNIVFIEFFGTVLRIIGNTIAKSWTDAISKVIKGIGQSLSLKNKFNKTVLVIISIVFLIMSSIIIYLTNDMRYLVAIIPSLLEFYALLSKSTKEYRWYIVITKIFWTINNIIFRLYVGILFDALVIIGHMYKLNKKAK